MSNNKNSDLGCGCLVSIIAFGITFGVIWHALNTDAGTFTKFLVYGLISTFIILAFLDYITSIDEDDKGLNGCLFAIFHFISSLFKSHDIFEEDTNAAKNNDTISSEKVSIGLDIPKEQPARIVSTSSGGNIVDNKKTNANNIPNNNKEQTEERIINNNPKKILIEEKLYNKLKTYTNQLIDLCSKTAEDKDFCEYMANVARDNGSYISSDASYIQSLLLELAFKDIFTCMDKMGCSVKNLSTMNYSASTNSGSFTVKYDSLEGQVLLALMFIKNNRYSTYADFKPVIMNAMIGRRSTDVDIAEADIYKYYSSKTGVSTDAVSDYQLSIVLRSISKDEESQKYKKILYGIASCFAYADGVLLQKEKSFLNELGKDAGVVDVGITVDDAPDASLEDLDSLIGLKEVKESIRSLVNFIKVNQKRESMGLKVPSISYHCVFTGNPGTGKTTVARILAGIYKQLGILKTGQLVETDRSGLVAEYVGQTAIKTNKIIDQAIGGVLFIDEAYSLVGGGNEDYGKEAISTLLKRMEDDRDKLVVILAGYSNEMETFINSNPGLRSRFSRYINFPDYSAEELFDIFKLNMKKFDYHLTKDAEDYLKVTLADRVDHKTSDFGNAREVRNLFEKVVEAQSDRLLNIENLTKETMSEFTLTDIQRACKN